MNRFTALVLMGALGLAPSLKASSYKLQYGGRLTTATGYPLKGPTTLSVNFYDSLTNTNALATQGFTNVPLNDGIFNVTIDLPAANWVSLFAASELWIEIVDNGNGKIYPRQRFGAVPFAFRTPTDDLTLGYDANGKLSVRGLGTAALPTGAPADGQVLKWQSGSWVWANDNTGGTPGSIDSVAIQDSSISNDDIAAGAAISGSKIIPNFGSQNIVTTGTITGDGSGLTNIPAGPLGTSIDSSEIQDGSITNDDIAAGAAIAQSKINGLSTSLAAKEDAIASGTAAQYLRGDKTWATLDTAAIPEGSNLFFTDARARGAISATAPLSYNSGTGSFSIPAATSVANGYLSSSDWLTFSNKQAAISASSTVNTGSLTTALQSGLEIKPYGSAPGEAGELRFTEVTGAGSNYIGFRSPDDIAANRIWTLPAADGTSGQVLSTNGTGTLIWASAGGGGTVTSITAGTGLSGGAITGAGTIDLANTAVTPGSYTRGSFTVDAQGRLTAASNGANIDLTSEISGALPVANGGTGATTAPLALSALGAAASGANTDITSLGGLTTALTLGQGGTGATTAPLARTALGLGDLATLNAVGASEITDASIADADISASAAIDASKIADGSVSSAEFQYISTLTSNVQSQLDAKASAANPSFTGIISAPMGAVGAPSFTFTGDPNTGIWSRDADSLDFSTAGANRLSIIASGNVGIGTTDPSAKFQVSGGQSAGTFATNTDGNINWNNGNIQTTDVAAGPITMTNMIDGAGYTLVLSNATGGSYSVASAGLTIRCSPACPVIVDAGTDTVLAMVKGGNTVWLTWSRGFDN